MRESNVYGHIPFGVRTIGEGMAATIRWSISQNWHRRAQVSALVGDRLRAVLTRAMPLAAAAAILAHAAVVSAADVSVSGQVRPRFEYRTRPGDAHDTFTSMRVRAGIFAKLEKDVRVMIQLQDVRLWGEETNTLGDFQADRFDLHQGYLELGNLGDHPLSVRAGRQAIALGGQRLIGAVEWTQQGRAMDGLRVTANPGKGKVDAIAVRLKDATSAAHATNAYLLGAYGSTEVRPKTSVDAYALYNRESGGADTDQTTFGLRLYGSHSYFAYRFEGSYQSGTRAGEDVAASMAGARLGIKGQGGKVSLTIWYDYLSGDDDPVDGKTKVFDTLFATNHKFYGFADLFLNIPAHTGGLGLQDIALKGSFSPNKPTKVSLDLHRFSVAKQGTLTGSSLGTEVDLTVSYKYSKEVSLVAGASRVFAKDPLIQLGRLDDDLTFTYLMTNVSF